MNGNLKVLIVDDEHKILELLKSILKNLPIEIITAQTGEIGIKIIKNTSEIAVVISNFYMGNGMTGGDFLYSVKSLSPKSVRILMTGGKHEDCLEDMVKNGEIDRFSKKPLLVENFVKQVKEGIRQYLEN